MDAIPTWLKVVLVVVFVVGGNVFGWALARAASIGDERMPQPRGFRDRR